MFWGLRNRKDQAANRFFVSSGCFPQTIDLVKTRAGVLDIEVVCGDPQSFTPDQSFFGALIQYPDLNGSVEDYSAFCSKAHEHGILVCVASDLLALTLLKPPGEWGADCVVGNAQRFGVPMGYGGPHAAFFATREDYKRVLPGRIIGVSVDSRNKTALRMALQTREQHIRREKATSNICTAQALLAIISGMYAVYHGPDGLKAIGARVHSLAALFADGVRNMGFKTVSNSFFDTVSLNLSEQPALYEKIRELGLKKEINLSYRERHILSVSFDETHGAADLKALLSIFAEASGKPLQKLELQNEFEFRPQWNESLSRKSAFLTHPVFHSYRSETRLMRYIKTLENKDLSLTRSMIPLGSCTMKLNAAAELEPLSWPEFAHIHPFAPIDQAAGYLEIIHELEEYLNEVTGFAGSSLQPNSGAQGEYAGLLVIRAYQKDMGQGHRNIALIPASAHGTNPASAVMAGLEVVVVNTAPNGNIDFDDLAAKAEQHAANLCCLMITYPSTHGVFEDRIREVCDMIHAYGGQVYMDGANLNAQVGLTSPGLIGADVNHINLHKTFAIPHGGGGPGMGPICVAAHLKPYLPGHSVICTGGEKGIGAVSAAPYGSASILLISYGYIRMLGATGVADASRYAILNANYIKARLSPYYDILYTGEKFGHVAHELILDFRAFKHTVGIEVEDVAKRLMDYGFHAPTVSFPVAGTLMIEPTESEDLLELDRFCEAMMAIREEIGRIENGSWDKSNNPLKHAPHTLDTVLDSGWDRPYSRETAAFPLPYLQNDKFWPSVGRVNNSHGDRNLICTCPSVEEYR